MEELNKSLSSSSSYVEPVRVVESAKPAFDPPPPASLYSEIERVELALQEMKQAYFSMLEDSAIGKASALLDSVEFHQLSNVDWLKQTYSQLYQTPISNNVKELYNFSAHLKLLWQSKFKPGDKTNSLENKKQFTPTAAAPKSKSLVSHRSSRPATQVFSPLSLSQVDRDSDASNTENHKAMLSLNFSADQRSLFQIQERPAEEVETPQLSKPRSKLSYKNFSMDKRDFQDRRSRDHNYDSRSREQKSFSMVKEERQRKVIVNLYKTLLKECKRELRDELNCSHFIKNKSKL